MARHVVAGGAGFLGSHICEALLERGDHVVCVDNLLTGTTANIAHLIGHPRFEFCEQDVTRGIHVEGAVDIVMNLASPASPKHYAQYPIETLEAGSLGTRTCIDLALRTGARLLMASTSEVYGDPAEHPQTEQYHGNVNPVGVRSVYDEAKRFSEAMVMAFVRTHGLDARIARIFNTYGPRMAPDDGRVVSTFIVQALRGEPLTVFGDGSQTRSFCYVDDEVAGLIALAESDVVGPVNIGNPGEFSVGELASLVLELTASSSIIEYRDLPSGDPSRRRPDISLARRQLGWEPQVPLRDGLQRTIDHYRTVVG